MSIKQGALNISSYFLCPSYQNSSNNTTIALIWVLFPVGAAWCGKELKFEYDILRTVHRDIIV
jgi:hypothetical protein